MKFAIIGCNSEDAITYPHHTEVVTTPYGNARQGSGFFNPAQHLPPGGRL